MTSPESLSPNNENFDREPLDVVVLECADEEELDGLLFDIEAEIEEVDAKFFRRYLKINMEDIKFDLGPVNTVLAPNFNPDGNFIREQLGMWTGTDLPKLGGFYMLRVIQTPDDEPGYGQLVIVPRVIFELAWQPESNPFLPIYFYKIKLPAWF